MGRYSLSFFLFIFLFSLVACQDDDERALKNPGILSLVLASDTTFGGNFVATKATVLEELAGFTDPNEYAVEILQGEQVVLSFDRYADMPDEIELSAGSYTMRAYKGTNKPGAFANPYFEGKTNFVIEKDMRTPIRDTATLANTRVFVNYTEDFLDAYEEFRIRMNTEYMETDTLSFREDETRGAYFKSDATGTELILSLWLVKREDTIINYYKPTPLTIYPRENVGLLFKTDDGALTGIGLEVTVNRGFEGDTILNMTIPEYAWGDAEEPTLSTTYFPDSLDNITYFALQENTYDPGYVYLDYIVPAGVGRCMVQIKRIEENNSVTLEEYDLATPAGANAARSIGITLG
ncbi:MAG: DUF4493 domain-containing protein, partial [Tannerellaceae bacterium]|nr:DUF4493 domain-containing protein [Tannerellaceae bacterium]